MSFTPQSLMPLISWPAITGNEAAQLMAMLYQLEQSQYWSAEQIANAQFLQLNQLLPFAVKYSPFYAALYQQLSGCTNQPLTDKLWQTLPIISKAQLQQAGEQVRCSPLPEYHQVNSKITTSGSTGQPLSVITTNFSQLFWQALTLRDHFWHQRDFNNTLAVIRSPQSKPLKDGTSNSDTWGSPATLFGETGKSYFISIELNVKQQLSKLLQTNCHYLLAFPTNLAELIRESVKQGVKPAKLKQVRTVGEIVSPELRELCRQHWQVDIADMYSCQEAGYIALQCPDNPNHYHIQSETVKVEILDSDNQPCQVGETGKVVITSLHNFANPLIRYEIGDYATLGSSCSCGRNLPVLTRIQGRTRNMLTLPNGERLWPYLSHAAFYQVKGLQQFQVIQHHADTLEFHYVAAQPFNQQQQAQCQAILHSYLQHPFKINFIRQPQIERSKGGKFEDFKSLIN